MARLTAGQRKKISTSNFAVPEKAPGPGSYPIEDAKHARLAVQMAPKNPQDAGRIRAKVAARFPGIAQDMADKFGGQ